jgi:hypothetical protein
MLNLKPFEICSYGDSCKFKRDAYMGICHGIKAGRVTAFICDLVEEENAGNNGKISQNTSNQEEKRR